MKNAIGLAPKMFLFVLVPILGQCRKEPERTDSFGAQAPPAQSSAITHAATPAPAASAENTASSAPDSPDAHAAELGSFLESPQYKFKVTKIQRCSESSTPLLLGVTVQIAAKLDEVFASSRDVTLEQKGVIFHSEIDAPSGCGAPLKPRQLKRGESASGAVYFKLPEESYAHGATLAFQPTRWGGAPRVRFNVPDCLDKCADVKAPKSQRR